MGILGCFFQIQRFVQRQVNKRFMISLYSEGGEVSKFTICVGLAALALQERDFDWLLLEAVDEGVKLLGEMKETTSKMVKIVIIGYPVLQNIIEAVNRVADVYIIKPLDTGKVLDIIKEHLRKQQESKKYSQEKVTEFIETQAKELEEERTIGSKKTR